MKLRQRFYVLFSAYAIATLGLFFTGLLWFFVLPLLALGFLFVGGKRHV